MISDLFLTTNKRVIQIGTCAEHLAMACDHGALDSRIQIDQGESVLKLGHHLGREGIVLVRPVKRDQYDRRGFWSVLRDMAEADLFEGNLLEGLGYWDLLDRGAQDGHDEGLQMLAPLK